MSDERDKSIEEYLAVLRHNLRPRPFARRRILREIESHLLDAAAQEEKAGAARADAERIAVERLGPVEGVVSHAQRPMRPLALGVVLGIAATAAMGAIFATLMGRSPVLFPPVTTISTTGPPLTVSIGNTVTFSSETGTVQGAAEVTVSRGDRVVLTYTAADGINRNESAADITLTPGLTRPSSESKSVTVIPQGVSPGLLRFVQALQ